MKQNMKTQKLDYGKLGVRQRSHYKSISILVSSAKVICMEKKWALPHTTPKSSDGLQNQMWKTKFLKENIILIITNQCREEFIR